VEAEKATSRTGRATLARTIENAADVQRFASGAGGQTTLRPVQDRPNVYTPKESDALLPFGAVSVELACESLWLLPERAVFWPERGMLLVADAHIGKGAAFRSAGVAIPAGTTMSDLERLSCLIGQLGARQIVFLGDLLHSRESRQPRTLEAFGAWRARHTGAEMILVRGNHDRRAGDPPTEWHLHCMDQPVVVGGFALCHDPRPVNGSYVLAGHVHPAVRMTGRGRDRARLPCFLLRRDDAILPAFGGLTGTFTVAPRDDDRVFVVAGDAVAPVGSRAPARSACAFDKSKL
jgi:DNA ligase-associated metallophosphoesterase